MTQERLAKAGLQCIGDLQKLSRQQLIDWLGENPGSHFYALAHGIDPRPVQPERVVKSISQECTFEQDISNQAECETVLLEQSEAVGRRLRRQGLKGWVVRLKLRFPPFITLTRQRKLDRPTDDDLEIYRCVRELFLASWESKPVRLLGVGVADFDVGGRRRQLGLFDAEVDDRPTKILQAMDSIRDRFGEGSIGHGR